MNSLLRVFLVLLLPFAGLAEEAKVPTVDPSEMFDGFGPYWYSDHLKAMGEEALPPLAKDKDAVVYRFTCLRTFDHPFSIKISKTKDGFTLRRKVLSGKGGYEPGKLQKSVKSALKAETVAALDKLLTETKFNELKAKIEEGGLDGSLWFLEVVKNGEYRIVDRWSPDEGSVMRKIGEWFLSAAKWRPQDLY